jgi:hypothetical protein
MKAPSRPCDQEVLLSSQQLGEAIQEYLLCRGLVRAESNTTAVSFLDHAPDAAVARVRVWYGTRGED